MPEHKEEFVPPREESTTTVTIRLTVRQKVDFQEWAINHELYLTDVLLQGAELLVSLPDGLRRQMEKAAWRVKMRLAAVITHLLQSYVASEEANIEVFGCGSKTFARAFQVDPKTRSLITGDRLSEVVHEQQKADALALRTKLIETKESGRPLYLTPEEAGLLADILPARV